MSFEKPLVIAIDGPAAAGKSTVARQLAKELGLRFLDTGSMYRAITLVALRAEIDPEDAEACARIAREIVLSFDKEGHILINGVTGEPDIRSVAVSRNASAVSAHPSVRAEIVPLQRAVAERVGGVVAEGRDTTTVVFPNASVKFFLWASPAVRASRRAEQLGAPERTAEIQVKIEERDRKDSSRADSPLREAEDAIRVDTGDLDADETLRFMLSKVRAVTAHE